MAIKRNRKASVKRVKTIIPQKENLETLTMIESLGPKKISKSKFFIPLVVILIGAILFYFKGLFVVALVNGEPIFRLSLIAELEKQGGKQTLSSLVNQTLILQEAKKKNIEVSQEEIDKSAKQIEDSLKTQGQNLDTALAMQGMTRQDFMMQLKLRGLVEKLLADQIKVTDKEVADYIDQNKETLPTDLKEEEIKQSVREQLKQQKLAGKSQEWLDSLNKNAKINYFVNY
ncbi:MAG: SurA N-terminal domain-containing protein [Candidatus Levybacteria bacterium]|nr:SurA N-terminal domain-containing protein [Candidatus Levybacteria bacterium]